MPIRFHPSIPAPPVRMDVVSVQQRFDSSQAKHRSERKKHVARRFIESEMPILEMNCRHVESGDTSALDDYEILAGPVPSVH